MLSSDDEMPQAIKTKLLISVLNTYGVAFKDGSQEEAPVYDSEDKFKHGPV